MHGHYDAAMLMAIGQVKTDVESARPDAPVVPDLQRMRRLRRATAVRSAVARLLDRAARAVEPDRQVSHHVEFDCGRPSRVS